MATTVQIISKADVDAGRTRPALIEQEQEPTLEMRFVGMRWRRPSDGITSMWINNGGNPTWLKD